MSRIAWRWFDLGPQGQLLSFNGEVWGPGEAVVAECAFGGKVRCSHHRAVVANSEYGVSKCPDCDATGIVRFEERHAPDAPEDLLWLGGSGSRQHKCPDFDCSCGIYCFKWAEDALALPRVGGYRRLCKVVGAIEVWGRLVETEMGYRAEYAIPRALHVRAGRLHEVYRGLVDIAPLPALIERWDVND